jgi:hypothetical protein
MLSVIMPTVTMLRGVIALSAIILNDIMQNAIMPKVTILSDVMLCVITLCAIILNLIMKSVIKPNVVMQSDAFFPFDITLGAVVLNADCHYANVKHCVITLGAVILNVIITNVIMLNDIMQSGV